MNLYVVYIFQYLTILSFYISLLWDCFILVIFSVLQVFEIVYFNMILSGIRSEYLIEFKEIYVNWVKLLYRVNYGVTTSYRN